MAADKFNCPKCGFYSVVNNTVVSAKGITRYRHCGIVACNLHFATFEALKETPRLRQIVGEDKAISIWGKPGFKYRTIAQQNRAKKTSA